MVSRNASAGDTDPCDALYGPAQHEPVITPVSRRLGQGVLRSLSKLTQLVSGRVGLRPRQSCLQGHLTLEGGDDPANPWQGRRREGKQSA